jgi:hypothetical protein
MNDILFKIANKVSLIYESTGKMPTQIVVSKPDWDIIVEQMRYRFFIVAFGDFFRSEPCTLWNIPIYIIKELKSGESWVSI